MTSKNLNPEDQFDDEDYAKHGVTDPEMLVNIIEKKTKELKENFENMKKKVDYLEEKQSRHTRSSPKTERNLQIALNRFNISDQQFSKIKLQDHRILKFWLQDKLFPGFNAITREELSNLKTFIDKAHVDEYFERKEAIRKKLLNSDDPIFHRVAEDMLDDIKFIKSGIGMAYKALVSQVLFNTLLINTFGLENINAFDLLTIKEE